jgi:(p)ppGpp synthase/HD superfamily hydrolase
MAERVLRTARETGATAAELPLLGRAHALAMEPRLRQSVGAHHPDLLHPGRTALILLLDTAERRAGVLAAALLAESERPELAAARHDVVRELGPEGAEAVAVLDALPDPRSDDLAESLLLAPEDVQRVALAERLDQVRHAHLWNDPERARAAHRKAVDVYAAIAERVHPKLARRYDWWCAMFERNYLR